MIYPQDYIFFHELNMSYEERKKRFMKNVSKLAKIFAALAGASLLVIMLI